MDLLGKLTGGGVDWNLQIDGGVRPLLPGETLRGNVSFTAHRTVDARALIASLVCVETYTYQSRSGGRNQTTTTTRASDELGRVAVPLTGPAQFQEGQMISLRFELTLPPDAPPTLDTSILDIAWRLEAKLDTGGRDPSIDQPLLVLAPAGLIRAAAAFLSPDALMDRTSGIEDGNEYSIWIQPTPFVLGAPFQAVLDTRQPLELEGIRAEVKLHVESRAYSSVVRETSTVWQGTLVPEGQLDGWNRYTVTGQLPERAVPTIGAPHGHTSAEFDVIVNRRMRRDDHFRRDVALASGP